MEKQDILEILTHVNPAALNYQEWVNVGMALKIEGHTAADWDNWSKRDGARYHSGECFKKWDTFNGSGTPVTAGTIVQYAKDQGWTPPCDEGQALEWDDIIGRKKEDLVVVNEAWIEGQDVVEPDSWNPPQQLIQYLEALFDKSENVGYVCESWEKDGKYLPQKGCYDRTADELIQLLKKCNGDIGAVLGDYNKEAGAWIRFNPLDGNGVKNENVTAFKYALVESDTMDISRQNAIIRELELPVVMLVYSGGKSLHAIVRIEASNYEEYRKRVDYLYNVCQKNGLKIDSQNRNPSRLSRMPGVERKGQKQFIVDSNFGKGSWQEWQEWIEAVNDDLPEPESMADVWDDLPELSPALIEGVLRQGHKLLLAGPSKAGKSYALIELCCAIAEGKKWLNWECAQGKVMYVNLELDRASCLHRFKDVYQALGWDPGNIANIDIWNLRGKAVPMDKLAPKLIRRAAKKNYIAIIIDPIYKVITGDENSADQMAHFCNQFDRVCSELGAAVIYCHHHSKGTQGNKKSMDRASGSGVFARDPDAMLDLIELELTKSVQEQQENRAACNTCGEWLNKYADDNWEDTVGQDTMIVAKAFIEVCKGLLTADRYDELCAAIKAVKKQNSGRTAWRIDGTLREFPKFPPCNIWFDYPIHHVDDTGILKDVETDGAKSSWKSNFGKKKSPEERKKERKESIETAINSCNFGDKITVKELADYLGVTEKCARSRIKEHGEYIISGNEIFKKANSS